MTEIDVKYLREKNIPTLIEKLAAEIVSRKPADPEAFLKEKYALADDGGLKRGDSVAVYGPLLDPATGVVLLAAGFAGLHVEFKAVDLALPSADFVQLSPLRRAPAVDVHGIVTVEAGAAARLLLMNTGALPLSARPRAKIESAYETIMATVLAQVSLAINEKVFAPRKNNRPIDPLALTAALETAKSTIPGAASAFFKESEWVVGKEVSLADFALASALFAFHNVLGVDIATLGEPINRFWKSVQQQPFYAEGTAVFAPAAMPYQQA